MRHRLYELEYRVAQLLDGKKSNEKVAKAAQKTLKTYAKGRKGGMLLAGSSGTKGAAQ